MDAHLFVLYVTSMFISNNSVQSPSFSTAQKDEFVQPQSPRFSCLIFALILFQKQN